MVISLWILESESDAVCGMLSSDFKRYTLRVRSSNKLSGPSSPHDKLSHHHAFLVPRETIMYRLGGPREAAVRHSRPHRATGINQSLMGRCNSSRRFEGTCLHYE